MWYRKAELKHGRVSMAAVLGYAIAKSGIYFNAFIEKDGVGGGVKFADLVATNPYAEWGNVPEAGQIQLLLIAAGIELAQQQNEIDGGKIGEIPIVKKWIPWLPQKPPADEKEAAKRAQSHLAELKNGRLAMIGIAGFYASENIPGSVPFHF